MSENQGDPLNPGVPAPNQGVPNLGPPIPPNQGVPNQGLPVPPNQGLPLNQGSNFMMEKPEYFGGEKYEDVDDFVLLMSMYIRGIHMPGGTEAEIERYKVVILHRHLVGRAHEFWMELNPAKKATYELATTALKQRFPAPSHETARLTSKNRALAEMNNLVQSNMTSEEYLDKVKELYAVLGDEHALSLATRFVDGINDHTVQVQVDHQTHGSYARFMDVIDAYTYSTATTRRRELAVRAHDRPPPQPYDQALQQMGELFKGILSNSVGHDRASGGRDQAYPPRHIAYQPIVGTVGQQHRQLLR